MDRGYPVSEDNKRFIVQPGWIAPVAGPAAILDDCSLVVRDGLIEALVPCAEARRKYPDYPLVDLPRHLLIPGFVNAHGHAAMSLLRGYADDMALQTWLGEHIWPAEQKWVDDSFVRDGTMLACAEMLGGGTTTFADMYFFPDACARAVRQAGMRARIYAPVISLPTAWARDDDEYLERAAAFLDSVRDDTLVSAGFGPHAPYTLGNELMERVASMAAEMGDAPIQIHLHETATEVSDSMSQHGMRPLARIREHGLLRPQTQCVHMTQVHDSDIEQLADCGARVVHCPQSNLKLASGFCPVHRLMQADITVALGTDGPASNNNLSMLGEMRSAALLAKAVSGDPSALPAARALQMATLDGARALGLDEHTGSLEVGKAADMVALSLDGPEALPCYDPLSQLVYSLNDAAVRKVWVAGHLLCDEGRLLGLERDEIVSMARGWGRRLAEARP